MFSKNQIEVLLQAQDELNQQLDPNWQKNNWNFMLAASLECAEAIEHHGWKWWKHQEPDIDQVKMELIDILHFLLSELIVTKHDAKFALEKEDGPYEINFTPLETLTNLLALTNDDIISALLNLVDAFHTYGMSGEEVFKMYMGKYCLNLFRWSNGYKEGTYIKIWSGKEDNEYLTAIIDSTPADTPNFKEVVLEALTAAYTTHN